jgi:hypothetical protein
MGCNRASATQIECLPNPLIGAKIETINQKMHEVAQFFANRWRTYLKYPMSEFWRIHATTIV